MTAKVLIGGICEQDTDLFLLEECVSNRAFLAWLLGQIPGWPQASCELLTAARSVNQWNGESDLELTVGDDAGCVGKILIENKLAAGFQPQQLARYRQRAATYVERGECVHSAVVLFAPSAYARGAVDGVDAVVSYEAVETWFAATESDERTGYKLQLLRTALAKHRLGYNPDTDGAVTAFWDHYWREAGVLAPDLQLDEPGPKPAGAGFVWFFPMGLPANLNICHKLPKGFVDLQVPAWGHRVLSLKDEVGSVLEAEMEVIRASKSAAIRIRVSALNTGAPFAEQLEAVREGLRAANQLLSWARRNRAQLLRVLAPPTGGAG